MRRIMGWNQLKNYSKKLTLKLRTTLAPPTIMDDPERAVKAYSLKSYSLAAYGR